MRTRLSQLIFLFAMVLGFSYPAYSASFDYIGKQALFEGFKKAGIDEVIKISGTMKLHSFKEEYGGQVFEMGRSEGDKVVFPAAMNAKYSRELSYYKDHWKPAGGYNRAYAFIIEDSLVCYLYAESTAAFFSKSLTFEKKFNHCLIFPEKVEKVIEALKGVQQ